MPFRFRRSIKILPGVHLNVGKSGIGSISIGGLNIGKKGMFENINLRGTGLSYRLPLLGNSGGQTLPPGSDQTGSTQHHITWALQDDGSVELLDSQGNSIPDRLAEQVRRENKAALVAWLHEQADWLNQTGDALGKVYLTTPPPAPEGSAGPSGDEAQSKALSDAFSHIDWHTETTASFDFADKGRTVLLDVDLPEEEAMPGKEAHVSEMNICITFKDRPQPQIQADYVRHIHAIAFRLIGEVFARLPGAQMVVFSGYSERANKNTGNVENQYLLSVRVAREKWQVLNFNNLGAIDVVSCFEQFELRRSITRQGAIGPIEPFDA